MLKILINGQNKVIYASAEVCSPHTKNAAPIVKYPFFGVGGEPKSKWNCVWVFSDNLSANTKNGYFTIGAAYLVCGEHTSAEAEITLLKNEQDNL